MKYYRLNQIAMAVLLALLLFFGARTIVNIAYEEHEPEKPGLEVATSEAEKPKEAEAAGEAPAEGGSEVASLLASADPARGESAAAICKVCHSFDKGQPSPMGPPLHGVIGRDMASVEGFNYSPALKGIEGDWDYESLDALIQAPQTFAPGTIMAFPGIPDAQQRADVIVFLRTKHDNPPPLPEAGAAAPAAEEAAPAEPAEEAAPAAEEAAPDEPMEPAAEPDDMSAEPMEAPAPSMGEPPSPSQPQPVYPDETGDDMSESMEGSESAAMGEPASPSQPQPVYPDGAGDDMSESMEGSESAAMGEPASPSQPQPVYPDGAPDSE
jgi:cytochrome c